MDPHTLHQPPDMTSIRLELGISAQKIASMVMINNQTIEQQLTKGIEQAFQELTEDKLVQAIKHSVQTEMITICNKAVFSWEMRSKITQLIEKKIGERIEAYADKIAADITKNLDTTK